MRAVGLLCVVLGGCGRVGFDARDGATGDDAPPPGTAIRWMRTFLATPGGNARVHTAIPDGTGAATLVLPFTGGVVRDGITIAAPNAGVNTVIMGVDPTGATTWAQHVHAGTHCDLRAVAYLPGGDLMFGGYTMGPPAGTGNPCDLGVGSPQDPIVMRYSSTGTFLGAGTFDAGGVNAQIHHVTAYADGSIAIYGIYGGSLAIDGVVLPPAPPCCEATFVARSAGATRWQHGLASTGEVRPEAMGAAGGATGDVCITGWFDTAMTFLGVPIAPVGAEDVWVARLAPDGAPRFVRALGSSTGDHAGGVVATAAGGCRVQLAYTGTLVAGGAVGDLPNQGGSDIAIIELDATGAAVAAGVIASPANEVAWGIAATATTTHAVVGLNGRITIGTTTIDPAAADAVVVSLAGVAPGSIRQLITGGGDVVVRTVAAAGGDLTLAGHFTGDLVIGTNTASASEASGFAVALAVE